MPVSISVVQNALLYGINLTLQKKAQLAPVPHEYLSDRGRLQSRPPAYFDKNIEAGLDYLQQIGLGRPPHRIKGSIVLHAIRRKLPVRPASSLNVDSFLAEHGVDLAALIYALHHQLPEIETLVMLDGVSIFSADQRIQSLLEASGGENTIKNDVSGRLLDLDTGMDVFSFSEEIFNATQLWWDAAVELQEGRGNPQRRAKAAIQFYIGLLQKNSVKFILSNEEFIDQLAEKYPAELNEKLIEDYRDGLNEFYRLLRTILSASLEQRVLERLDQVDWESLDRSLLRSCIGASSLVQFDDPKWLENDPIYSVEFLYDVLEQQAEEVFDMWQILARQAGSPDPSWKNLWGRGWNPLQWF